MDTDEQKDVMQHLLRAQEQLRERLMQELVEEGETLEGIFDPESYSNRYENYKYKYGERLDTLNRILAELQRHRTRKSEFKFAYVRGDTCEELVEHMNKKIGRLRVSAVNDVKLVRDREEKWIALVIYSV